MISMIVGSVSGGTLNTKIGYYTPLAIVGTCPMCMGNRLLAMFEIHTGAGKWIRLPKMDVPTRLALMLLGTLLGASVFVSAGENVLTNQLVKRLAGAKGVDASMITSGGATSFLQSLQDGVRNTALVAYNEALRGAASLEWMSVKKPAREASAKDGEKETTEKV
ncbi:hypothetical protein BDW71DRAFT_201229 [Aspergillus fruticulosus]